VGSNGCSRDHSASAEEKEFLIFLAMDSLIYAAMDPEEKERALEFWRKK
jgi:hypothetical protein